MNNSSGKISVLGKANDIYNDFLRWYYPTQYENSSFVDDLLQDNIDWKKQQCLNNTNKINNAQERQNARNDCNEEYDNKSIEDYRSDLEITEFEKVEETVTVEDDGNQYSIPNYNKLQEQANKGAFIIGIRKRETKSDGHYSSGHIVMLLPFDESEGNEEGRGSMITVNSNITIYYPYSMECGGNYKDQDWLGTKSFLNMKWYIYK
jgi:hypothetical protein